MNNMVQIIGLISAFLTTAAFLPQVIKTWRTRSTADLSPLMFILFFTGIAGWLIYGILKNDLPIILANTVTICLAGIILYFIIVGTRSYSIKHIGIYVNDLEKMKAFYCSTFKATAGDRYHNPKRKFTSYFLSFPVSAGLEIMHIEDRNPGNSANVDHIAISVGSKKEVNRFTNLLKEKGLKIISEPRTTGDGYYESKVEDPEGNHIEITI